MRRRKPMPTKERLKQLFTYRADGALINRKVRGRKVTVGARAGCINSNGRRVICVDHAYYLGSRLVFMLHNGCCPDYVDHENGIPDDDRIENLRKCTQQENCMNTSSRKGSSSRHKGVSKKGKWWVSVIHCKGRDYYIGHFADEDDAAKAYNDKATELHGEFAKLNEIPELVE